MSSASSVPEEIGGAATRGELHTVVKWLREGGHVDALIGSRFSATLLHAAAVEGQLALAKELLKRGGTVDLLDDLGSPGCPQTLLAPRDELLQLPVLRGHHLHVRARGRRARNRRRSRRQRRRVSDGRGGAAARGLRRHGVFAGATDSHVIEPASLGRGGDKALAKVPADRLDTATVKHHPAGPRGGGLAH